MPDAAPPADLYLHIRVIVGMVLGLAVARLLNGLAGFVQHPGRDKVWLPHLAWVGWMLLQVVGFWWWEFRLAEVGHWTFESYSFLLAYAALIFFLCTLLFPSDLADYGGYREYFLSRRGWFFGFLALALAMDVIDSLLKGEAHLSSLGPEYWARIAVHVVLCLAAMRIGNVRFQAAFAAIALAYQISWLARAYGTLP